MSYLTSTPRRPHGTSQVLSAAPASSAHRACAAHAHLARPHRFHDGLPPCCAGLQFLGEPFAHPILKAESRRACAARRLVVGPAAASRRVVAFLVPRKPATRSRGAAHVRDLIMPACRAGGGLLHLGYDPSSPSPSNRSARLAPRVARLVFSQGRFRLPAGALAAGRARPGAFIVDCRRGQHVERHKPAGVSLANSRCWNGR